MKSYSDKLKDPRWQKLRLEVFERDGFTCAACGCKERTLHVHHKAYLKRTNPWDYPNDLLLTLCEQCHGNIETTVETVRENAHIQWLPFAVRRFLVFCDRVGNDKSEISKMLNSMAPLDTSED